MGRKDEKHRSPEQSPRERLVRHPAYATIAARVNVSILRLVVPFPPVLR